MICSSLNLDFLIRPSFPQGGLYIRLEEFQGVRSRQKADARLESLARLQITLPAAITAVYAWAFTSKPTGTLGVLAMAIPVGLTILGLVRQQMITTYVTNISDYIHHVEEKILGNTDPAGWEHRYKQVKSHLPAFRKTYWGLLSGFVVLASLLGGIHLFDLNNASDSKLPAACSWVADLAVKAPSGSIIVCRTEAHEPAEDRPASHPLGDSSAPGLASSTARAEPEPPSAGKTPS